jgi:hypothetical protein
LKLPVAATVSRRVWLSRLLMAAAVAPVNGVTLADSVDASKKGQKKSEGVKKRAKPYIDGCKGDNGTPTVTVRPGGTTIACTGGDHGDWTCTVSSKTERCHKTLTNPPKKPLDDVSTTPTGGNEDPTVDGGSNASGGSAVPPGGTADPGGGSSDPVLE